MAEKIQGYLAAEKAAQQSKTYGTTNDTSKMSYLDRQTYLKNGGK